MIAEIVAIGSELVSGQALDTNSQWLSKALGELGISVHFHTSIGDDLSENIAAFRVARDRADLVITSGGLGPTQDDLTREALARLQGVPLLENADCLAAISAMFARRNRSMPERNMVQALIPEGADQLPNSCGTAPGVWMKTPERATFACLPGVPNELRSMFAEQVAPRLKGLGFGGNYIVHRKINLFGRGESDVEAQALDLTARGRKPEVGITVSEATISFRIIGEGTTEAEAYALMEPTAALIYERFGNLIVGEGTEDVVDALIRQLKRTDSTISVAESCTGGLIAHYITAIPDVSPYFPGGVVTYSNRAKVDLLGVPPELISEHGAVSPEVAEAMARGVRERFRSTIGIAVTGIAGPKGGTPEKPVGLVYMGLATAEKAEARRLDLGVEQPRDVIQRRSAKNAMNWARLRLEGIV